MIDQLISNGLKYHMKIKVTQSKKTNLGLEYTREIKQLAIN